MTENLHIKTHIRAWIWQRWLWAIKTKQDVQLKNFLWLCFIETFQK